MWDEGGRSGGSLLVVSFGVRVDIQGGSLDIQGGHLGCQGEGAEGPTNGPKGHSLPQELGISARSALYF